VRADATHTIPPRVWLAPVCLIVGPIVGVWAGALMPNPPGNGPGSGQVIVGGVLPIFVALAGSALARIRALEASIWALASIASTGAIVLFLMYLVEHVIRPA
jgi:hypothetical protein